MPPGPLRVMFVISSMGVGGAETLLVELVRRFDRRRIAPQVCFLRERGPLGEVVANDAPTYDYLLKNRLDVTVVPRMARLFREQRIDAVVTVCTGDKMFWGRLAARLARVPVVLSALHATGWPETLELPNRMLTGITTGFISVADAHRRFLIESERLPAEKVFVVRNGIDVERFAFDPAARERWRTRLGIGSESPVVGIIAALRPEKNHPLFLRCARALLRDRPDAQFVVAGDGFEREAVHAEAVRLELGDAVHFLDLVDDVPGVLSMLDLFTLTSKSEASPVSILEAMAAERPVVAPSVGSIAESVLDGKTGLLTRVGDEADIASKWLEILSDPGRAGAMGTAGRRHAIETGSVDSMTDGYASLIEALRDESRPA